MESRNPVFKSWNDMDGIYKNIEEFNPNKKRKTVIFLFYMINDILTNKKNYFFIRVIYQRWKAKDFICFHCTILFLSSTLFHYENSKQTRPSKNAFNHSSYIDSKDFIKSLQNLFCKTMFFISYWYYFCIR